MNNQLERLFKCLCLRYVCLNITVFPLYVGTVVGYVIFAMLTDAERVELSCFRYHQRCTAAMLATTAAVLLRWPA